MGVAMSRLQVLAVLLITLGAAPSPGQNKPQAITPEVDPPTYRIGPGDVLQVNVWKEPEASGDAVIVRPDGRISLALVGEVLAAGRTTGELERDLTQRFETYLRLPRVTVTIKEAHSQKVYVIGQVRKEGAIQLVSPLRVLQALAEAGGITDYAKRRNIYVLRVTNGRQINLPFNYDAVVRGQKVDQNVLLLSGDTIVVPR